MSHTSRRLCSKQLLREVSCFPASSEVPGATLVAHLQTGQHRRPGALSWTQHRPGLSSWSQPERAGLLLCPLGFVSLGPVAQGPSVSIALRPVKIGPELGQMCLLQASHLSQHIVLPLSIGSQSTGF